MKLLIEWKNDGSQEIQTFGILPDEMTDSSTLPNDEQIFYWLTPDEANAIGEDWDGGDWVVVRCACAECEDYYAENEAYQKAVQLEKGINA